MSRSNARAHGERHGALQNYQINSCERLLDKRCRPFSFLFFAMAKETR